MPALVRFRTSAYCFLSPAGYPWAWATEGGWCPRSSQREGPNVALETILIVDDAADVLELTAATLETAGYSVVRRDGGRAALAVLSDGHAIDLLLTDIAMPEMDGLELARQARALRPSLPIAYLTGEYAQVALDASRHILGPILRKPFRVAELLRQIGEILEAAEDTRIVTAVALEMFEQSPDALDRAIEEEKIARLSGDALSAAAWHDIAEAISRLRLRD